jgi:hypothetical protein
MAKQEKAKGSLSLARRRAFVLLMRELAKVFKDHRLSDGQTNAAANGK